MDWNSVDSFSDKYKRTIWKSLFMTLLVSNFFFFPGQQHSSNDSALETKKPEK